MVSLIKMEKMSFVIDGNWHGRTLGSEMMGGKETKKMDYI